MTLREMGDEEFLEYLRLVPFDGVTSQQYARVMAIANGALELKRRVVELEADYAALLLEMKKLRGEDDDPGALLRKPVVRGGERHTAASLADVLEKDYAPGGKSLFLSGHEWRLVVDGLRRGDEVKG